MPVVSVVIPIFNRERYLAQAMDSILAQTLTDFELLMVDDGSSDSSCEIVRAYTDPRIRLIRHERNRGVAAARNTGITEARGRYLAFLDSDDVAYPDRLQRQVEFLDRHPDYAAVGAWIDWMDEDGRPLGRIQRKAVAWDDIAAQRLFRPAIQNGAAMARTRILKRYRHDERFRVGEDFHLWARIASDHKMANLPRVLVRCRAHGQRITDQAQEERRAARIAIYGAQLDALGIAHTGEDLERHFRLRRMHKINYRPDEAYLDWAERWLCALREANRHAKLYPEPAFSRVLGAFWAKACVHAGRAQGAAHALARFWHSPLRPWAWAGIWKELILAAPRPIAALALRPVP